MSEITSGRIIGPTPHLAKAIGTSVRLMEAARANYQPTHIVAMVSGGRDSAVAYAIADEMGVPVNLGNYIDDSLG